MIDECAGGLGRPGQRRAVGLGLVGEGDGLFRVSGGEITGGGGGLWVAAVLTNMTVVLKKVTFSGLLGPAVEILEDGGFTATVVGGP